MKLVDGKFRIDMKNLGKNLSVEQKKELKEARKELDRVLCDMSANIYRKEYRETSNPLYIFKAYQQYRRKECRIPDWILNYFDDVAGLLFGEVAYRADGNKGGERAAFTIQSILGMKGNVFKKYAKSEKQLDVVSSYIKKRRSSPESSKEDIYMELEEIYNEPYKTIEGWIRKNEKYYFTL